MRQSVSFTSVANRQTWTVTRIGKDGSLLLHGRGRDREISADYATRFVELAYAAGGDVYYAVRRHQVGRVVRGPAAVAIVATGAPRGAGAGLWRCLPCPRRTPCWPGRGCCRAGGR